MRFRDYIPSFFVSAVIHCGIVAVIASYASISGCASMKEEIIPIDFTVAVEASPDAEDDLVEPPAPEPPEPEPLPAPDEIEPPPPPPEPDPIPEKKVEQKKPEQKKPEEKKPEQKKTETKKPEIKRGRRIKGPENHPAEQSKLSAEELKRRLKEGARAGQRDSLEPNELQKNILRIQKALHDSWDKPPRSDQQRPVVVSIRFDSFGNIVSSGIVKSSGNQVLDKSVETAVKRVRRIDGLTAKFLAVAKSEPVEINFYSE